MDNLENFENWKPINESEGFEAGDRIVYLRPGFAHDNETGTFVTVRADGKSRVVLDDGTRLAAGSEFIFPAAKKREVKKPKAVNDRDYGGCGQGYGGCGGYVPPPNYGGCGGGGGYRSSC